MRYCYIFRLAKLEEKLRLAFDDLAKEDPGGLTFDWDEETDGREFPDVEMMEQTTCESVDELIGIIRRIVEDKERPYKVFRFWSGKSNEYGMRLAWTFDWKDSGIARLNYEYRKW